MGDRACFVIRGAGAGDVGVGVYTHWCGGELPDLLRDGLRKARAAGRLTDGSYAARIVVESVLAQAEDKQTSWGLFSADEQHEDEHGGPIVVDLGAGTVRLTKRAQPQPLEAWIGQ